MNPNKIDRLLLEKVLGYEEAKSIWYDDFDKSKIYYKRDYYDLYVIEYYRDEWMQYLFNPLNNFEDAWQVVKKIKESRFSIRKRFIDELQKEVTPEETKNRGNLVDKGWMIFLMTPKDICLAALKAYGIEVEI